MATFLMLQASPDAHAPTRIEQSLRNRSCYVLMSDMQYRVADSELSLTLEVALSGAPTFMIADLRHRDRLRRSAAFAALAGHLAARTPFS